MMGQHFNQSDSVTGMLYYINLIFTTIFSTELILRFMALRWYYFSNGWNVFDLIIVVLSIVGELFFLVKLLFFLNLYLDFYFVDIL